MVFFGFLRSGQPQLASKIGLEAVLSQLEANLSQLEANLRQHGANIKSGDGSGQVGEGKKWGPQKPGIWPFVKKS